MSLVAEKHPIFVGELGAETKKMSFIPADAQKDISTWVPDMLGHIWGCDGTRQKFSAEGERAVQTFPLDKTYNVRLLVTDRAGDTGFVELSNANTDVRVVIDGVRWVWLAK